MRIGFEDRPGKMPIATCFGAFGRPIHAHKMLTTIREQGLKPDIRGNELL
jgi:hypothetical protein